MPIQIGQRPDHGFDQPLGLLSDCHRRIERFLQVLVAIDRRAKGAPVSAADRAELEGALAYFSTAAPTHTADEEASLFPRLCGSRDPEADTAREIVARLEGDHTEADRHHRVVDTLVRRWLDNGSLDPGARAELTAALVTLQGIYAAHIAIEDRELFPAAARLLSKDQLREIGREMAERRFMRPSKPDAVPSTPPR
jgi:hemerythrin-like domain-containing protein